MQENLYKEVDIRANKIKELKSMGINPYAERFEETYSISEARELEDGVKVSVAGRIIFRRAFGKFMFIQISNIYGKIQVSLSINEIAEETYKFFKDYVDIGDYVGIVGEMYTTQTGEKTVKTYEYKLLSKAVNPLPEKYHGLTDIEARYRQRYLDLVSNAESREVLLGRSRLVSFIRRYLESHGFVEVETPILQGAVCGASAKPFFTHHNALDKECNLRIAPEVYLKQVVAGGFPRVFEVAKCFRNEGMDASHLQEFTQVEWYASYWNFEDNIKFFTGFIRSIVKEIRGGQTIVVNGEEFDISKDFARVDYAATINKVLGFDVLPLQENLDELKAKVIATGMFDAEEIEYLKSAGAVIDYVYKRKVRPEIVSPTILFNYPACLVPLARRSDKDSRVIEMFQFLINGEELCKAYSELVDPVIQRETLEDQAKAKASGDEEAMDVDEDFLLAMEHGMPPMSGLGMGIDRLLVILYSQPSIRDVVLFPIMK
ncbi:MAG: lysine--tRNA ligase [Clostridiales bacterium]|nr:lysine--tRNA ligase [Clostridiales bacterium]